MLFNWALILIWPLLQVELVPIELGTRWTTAGVIDSGLDGLAAAVVCAAPGSGVSRLMAVDSSGTITELTFGDDGWSVVRTFTVAGPVTSVCAGATRGYKKDWDLMVGTRSGRVIAVTPGPLGWSKKEIAALPGPILNIQATTAAILGDPSSIFVIDGDSLVTEFVVDADGTWRSGRLPPIPGGATEVCFDYHREGLRVALAGAQGVIHRVATDADGIWRAVPWAHLSSPPLDMAASADPTFRDIAVFYSGADGEFRYLFYQRTDDTLSRLSVGGGTTFLIGKGDRRRFNEFFAVSGDTFTLFEFDTGLRDWIEIPTGKVGAGVVSTSFGPGRGEAVDHQIYVACRDGTIHEFVRLPPSYEE